MMARPRSGKHRQFPDNLYERKGYFSWRDPRTGKEYGLGRDKRSAFDQAIEANLHVAVPETTLRLVDRLQGISTEQTFGAWCDRYMTILVEGRELRKTSQDSVKAQLKAARAAWGSWPIAALTTLDVAELLREWTDAGKHRMAAHVRSRLVDLFREAQAAGWIKANPAEITRVRGARVKRERLTLEQFQAIHAQALADTDRPWIARMLELALLTGQRREDLAALRFDAARDGHLFVKQIKTGKMLALSLELALPCLPSLTLGSVVEACKHPHVDSPALLYHIKHAGKAKPGDKLYVATLSRGFAEAREAAGIATDSANPPSLHEIRSLSGRLYEKEYGKDFAQAIWGHRTAATSAIYLDVRGSEWANIAPPKRL